MDISSRFKTECNVRKNITLERICHDMMNDMMNEAPPNLPSTLLPAGCNLLNHDYCKRDFDGCFRVPRLQEKSCGKQMLNLIYDM